MLSPTIPSIEIPCVILRRSCRHLGTWTFQRVTKRTIDAIERYRLASQRPPSWLAEDELNQLIVVLDEAHMYQGAQGTEVALLLRRLVSRLRVKRDKIRFILTSGDPYGLDGSKLGGCFAQAAAVLTTCSDSVISRVASCLRSASRFE